MTIIAVDSSADVQLTDHDHILAAGEQEPNLIQYSVPWAITVNLHVHPDTPVTVHPGRNDDRIVVQFGGFSTEVDLFLHPGQLDRLINVLTVARSRLI